MIGIPSGMQPRAAVGYTFVSPRRSRRRSGSPTGIRTDIDAASSHLAAARDSLAARAAEIAAATDGAIPVIFGADLTAPVATRWKSQFNENSKLPAFAAELPEADHNEIVGWSEGRTCPSPRCCSRIATSIPASGGASS